MQYVLHDDGYVKCAKQHTNVLETIPFMQYKHI